MRRTAVQCGVDMDERQAARRAGILLHVTSLPSGRLDDDALRWLDWLADAGVGVWQLLPLVIPDAHGSPYQSASAFATDPANCSSKVFFIESMVRRRNRRPCG